MSAPALCYHHGLPCIVSRQLKLIIS
jgi:hypothetical protein